MSPKKCARTGCMSNDGWRFGGRSKVCGARTFLSAATLARITDPVILTRIPTLQSAADKNVRAPLRLRLCHAAVGASHTVAFLCSLFAATFSIHAQPFQLPTAN